MPVGSAHSRSIDDVAVDLGTDLDRGLSHEEVVRRRKSAGRNDPGSQEGVSPGRILWDQVSNVVVVLLVVAVVVGFAVGEVVEAIAVLVVITVNTIVGFVTELRSARAMDALSAILTVIADVERDDRRDEVDADDLVPGDIVTIEAGERVPADLRLAETEELYIDESALTGESEPSVKSADPVPEDTPTAERSSMAYTGTLVASGRGRGVVVAIGRETELGRVVELTEQTTQRKAPLQEGLDQLGRRLSLGVALGAVVLAAIGVARGRSLDEVVEIAIAVAIAVVPEGLPAVATLTLAVGMKRMADRGALVRRLAAVETLGSATVICSDKTGTLTENEMTVTSLETFADDDQVWQSAILCNDADIDEDGDPLGDPTEIALLKAAGQRGIDWRELREGSERTSEVPFDSAYKWMAVVVDGVAHVKGAPEVLIDGTAHPEQREAADRLAAEGLRVLAIGRGPAPEEDHDPHDGPIPIDVTAVVGLEDPPRESAIEAVATAHRAGIRVVMITGDRHETALAIAARLGLRAKRSVEGVELSDMGEDELARQIADVDVFARVDPAQKHRIVEALQRAHEVVAVTGDGVNDAPALSRADIGIAMGAGTDVAQEAAEVVLTQDDFATIEVAVAEGRRIFENIRRFAQFLFSWHVAEVAVVSAALVGGFATPLTGLAILWNNLIIDVLPSFALALEPSRRDVMTRPPRPPSEPVITREMIRRIAIHGALVAGVGFVAFALSTGPLGLELDAARAVVFIAMSGGQVLAVFNARTDRWPGFAGASANRWLWAALAVTAVLETAALTIAPLRDLLGLGLPGPSGLILGGGLALVPLGLVQGWRWLHRHENATNEREGGDTP